MQGQQLRHIRDELLTPSFKAKIKCPASCASCVDNIANASGSERSYNPSKPSGVCDNWFIISSLNEKDPRAKMQIDARPKNVMPGLTNGPVVGEMSAFVTNIKGCSSSSFKISSPLAGVGSSCCNHFCIQCLFC